MAIPQTTFRAMLNLAPGAPFRLTPDEACRMAAAHARGDSPPRPPLQDTNRHRLLWSHTQQNPVPSLEDDAFVTSLVQTPLFASWTCEDLKARLALIRQVNPVRAPRTQITLNGEVLIVGTSSSSSSASDGMSNESTCFRCREEDDQDTELLCCNTCSHSAHLKCVNLAAFPPADEPWFCSDACELNDPHILDDDDDTLLLQDVAIIEKNMVPLGSLRVRQDDVIKHEDEEDKKGGDKKRLKREAVWPADMPHNDSMGPVTAMLQTIVAASDADFERITKEIEQDAGFKSKALAKAEAEVLHRMRLKAEEMHAEKKIKREAQAVLGEEQTGTADKEQEADGGDDDEEEEEEEEQENDEDDDEAEEEEEEAEEDDEDIRTEVTSATSPTEEDDARTTAAPSKDDARTTAAPAPSKDDARTTAAPAPLASRPVEIVDLTLD